MRKLCQGVVNAGRQPVVLGLLRGVQESLAMLRRQWSSAVSELKRPPVAWRLSGGPEFGSMNGSLASRSDRIARPCDGSILVRRV